MLADRNAALEATKADKERKRLLKYTLNVAKKKWFVLVLLFTIKQAIESSMEVHGRNVKEKVVLYGYVEIIL